MISNLRCVGFDDVEDKTILKGATPMFQNFPFDSIKKFPLSNDDGNDKR